MRMYVSAYACLQVYVGACTWMWESVWMCVNVWESWVSARWVQGKDKCEGDESVSVRVKQVPAPGEDEGELANWG